MKFELTEEEENKYKIWIKEHNKTCSIKYAGAIGGKITFQFTPTSLGLVTQVVCGCGKKLNLTDYEGW
jgi:hypothetical protein